MSAATGVLHEGAGDGPDARSWIDAMRNGPAVAVAADTSDLAVTCAAAVDPLEIAAALEASGLSRGVIVEQLGFRDVFALAKHLWSRVPFREAPTRQAMTWRRGNASDLGRGALYAAPALLIHAARTSMAPDLPLWPLPLAMTWGWALGQLVAFGGYTMRGRGDRRGEARFIGLALVLAVVTTTGLAAIARAMFGGDEIAVIAAAILTTYMVASAVLLLHEQELLGAALLVPGAVVGAIAVLWPGAVPDVAVAAALGVSFVTTVLAACRHAGLPMLARSQVTRSDGARALEHAAHGVVCGGALSVVVLLAAEAFGLHGHAVALSAPLLATLGIMEWQLRTFRFEIEALARTRTTVAGFSGRALGLFVRCLGTYALGLIVVATVVAITVDAPGVIPVLVAESALGTMYYVDLTLTSLGRVDVVLRSWTAGVAAGAAGLGVAALVTSDLRMPAWWAAHGAVWVALAVALPCTAAVVVTPASH